MQIALNDALVGPGFHAQILVQLLALVMVVECFHGLLKADGDEQADDDGAMWMRKSRQVWTASWGGWTSSMLILCGGSRNAAQMERKQARLSI
jgi:hypothetical protein